MNGLKGKNQTIKKFFSSLFKEGGTVERKRNPELLCTPEYGSPSSAPDYKGVYPLSKTKKLAEEMAKMGGEGKVFKYSDQMDVYKEFFKSGHPLCDTDTESLINQYADNYWNQVEMERNILNDNPSLHECMMKAVFSHKRAFEIPEPKLFKCFVVLSESGKAICYLDESLGVSLELSLDKYRRENYKIIELSGEIK